MSCLVAAWVAVVAAYALNAHLARPQYGKAGKLRGSLLQVILSQARELRVHVSCCMAACRAHPRRCRDERSVGERAASVAACLWYRPAPTRVGALVVAGGGRRARCDAVSVGQLSRACDWLWCELWPWLHLCPHVRGTVFACCRGWHFSKVRDGMPGQRVHESLCDCARVRGACCIRILAGQLDSRG